MNLSHFKLGTKLGAAFFALIALTLVLGLGAINRLAAVEANVEDLATNWLPSVKTLEQLRTLAHQSHGAEAELVAAETPAARQAALQQLQALKQAWAQKQAAYVKLISSGEEQALYERYARERAAVEAASATLLQLVQATPPAPDTVRQHFQGALQTAFAAMQADLDRLVEINDRGAEAAFRTAQASYAQTRLGVIGLLALAVTVASGLAVWITRSITQPVARAIRATESIAAGDLSITVAAEGKDEVAQLLRALSAMKDQLARTVDGVRGNADSVATASAQIAQGNIDLSQRTEEQASALQQTAATMEQLSTTVRHNADNARQANQLAQGASAVAARGGAVVSDVVNTMKAIDEGSRKVVDIIGVIDGIAFQTNILALNAAVEAARAGEQGRGFAVVAGEVRILAQRSAAAAKEIKSLITASVEQVEKGTGLVGQAGQTMQEIVGAIQRVSDIVGEISEASAEQSNGVSQVGQAVSQMDQVTQQNAALVEQSAAAAESLKEQARQLVDAVAVFTLQGAPRAAA